MHALMAPVLLGVTWLDALHIDSESQPPDRKPAQSKKGIGGCEGHAIIGAYGIVLPELLENTLTSLCWVIAATITARKFWLVIRRVSLPMYRRHKHRTARPEDCNGHPRIAPGVFAQSDHTAVVENQPISAFQGTALCHFCHHARDNRALIRSLMRQGTFIGVVGRGHSLDL
jgi:hypothetical protein